MRVSYLKDYQSGKEGFTLAAILLLGKDELILSALPHYRTDAIVRRENIDRYNDRDDIRTNLIESYDRLMTFAAKHLPDRFYLERDQRISLRDHLNLSLRKKKSTLEIAINLTVME